MHAHKVKQTLFKLIHHQHFSQVGSLTVSWLGLLVLCGLIELAVGFLKQLSYTIALSVCPSLCIQTSVSDPSKLIFYFINAIFLYQTLRIHVLLSPNKWDANDVFVLVHI